MADDLTFAIYPEAETISLSLLLRTITNVKRIVQDVDYAVTQEKKRRWIVTKLQSSTPTITIKPVLDGSETIDAFGSGLETVMAGRQIDPPPSFTADALDHLKGMKGIFTYKRDRASRVVFTSDGLEVTVDQRVGERVERIERGTYSVLGSMEGILDAVNFHAKSFHIWDRVTGLPIRCSLPKNMTDQVKELLQHRVSVQGQINYYSNGMPRSLTKVSSLVDGSPDPSLPEASFGSIPDIIGDREPAEYLRAMRE